MDKDLDSRDAISIQEDLQHFIGKSFVGFSPDQIKKSELSSDCKAYKADSDELITLSVELEFSPKEYEDFSVYGLIKILKDEFFVLY